METKNVILVFIVILIAALIVVAALTLTDQGKDLKNATSNMTKNDTKVNTTNVTDNSTTNKTNATNKTVGDNSTLDKSKLNNTNKTYKVYNPQSDSYVEVIGEKFDDEVHRWYTYDKDDVRYYNTRII